MKKTRQNSKKNEIFNYVHPFHQSSASISAMSWVSLEEIPRIKPAGASLDGQGRAMVTPLGLLFFDLANELGV
jgi:hypothetical protein